MFYFMLMSYSPNLPPAVLCSLAVAYFVYFMMGGKVLCDDIAEPEPTEAPEVAPVAKPEPVATATIPTSTKPPYDF
jgi:hypothetical protein